MSGYLKVKQIIVWSVTTLLMVTFASTAVIAQKDKDETNAWHFGASIYGWFPDISGQTVYTNSGGDDFEVGIENILDNLEFTLMGIIDVRKGNWGILARHYRIGLCV